MIALSRVLDDEVTPVDVTSPVVVMMEVIRARTMDRARRRRCIVVLRSVEPFEQHSFKRNR